MIAIQLLLLAELGFSQTPLPIEKCLGGANWTARQTCFEKQKIPLSKCVKAKKPQACVSAFYPKCESSKNPIKCYKEIQREHRDFLKLAKLAYEIKPSKGKNTWELPQPKGLPPQTKLVRHYASCEKGFSAVSFRKGSDSCVFAFTGTNEIRDIVTDLQVGKNQVSTSAMRHVYNDIKKCQDQGKNLIFTGHSLGGALAQYVAYDFTLKKKSKTALVSWNAPGALELIRMFKKEPPKLRFANAYNYRLKGDPVSAIGTHFGSLMEFPSSFPKTKPITNHFMASIETSLRSASALDNLLLMVPNKTKTDVLIDSPLARKTEKFLAKSLSLLAKYPLALKEQKKCKGYPIVLGGSIMGPLAGKK